MPERWKSKPLCWGLALAALAASWLTFGWLWIAGLGIALLAVGYLAIARRGLAAALVAFSPYFVVPLASAAEGARDYAVGSPQIRTTGEALPTRQATDARTGYPIVTAGCVVDGTEGFYTVPYNAMVRLMAAVN